MENMWIKRHMVLFLATNIEIWIYKENMWIKRHIVLFITTNFEIWVYIESMCLFIHIVTFFIYKLSNTGIQGNENSFFTWYLKVVLNWFSWNLEFVSNESKTHYSSDTIIWIRLYTSYIDFRHNNMD